MARSLFEPITIGGVTVPNRIAKSAMAEGRCDVEGRPRRLSVNVKRPGMRAIHPSRYVFRSDSEKRESVLRAAWISPEMFQTGVVRAHAFPLRPRSDQLWEALLAEGEGEAEAAREFPAQRQREA